MNRPLAKRGAHLEMVTNLGSSGWRLRLINIAALAAVTSAIVVPSLGTISGDIVLDWLLVQGISDGHDPGTPVGDLAAEYGIDLGPPLSGFPSNDEWLHPRTPGLLLLQLPFLSMSPVGVSNLGAIVSGISWVLLGGFLLPMLIRQSELHRVGPWVVLATASAPVLMVLEASPHIALIGVLSGFAWLGLRRSDMVWPGILLGLAAVVRAPFALVIVGALLGGRRKAAAAGVATWVGVELFGSLYLRIPIGESLRLAREAAAQWVAVPPNGSVSAMAYRIFNDPQTAVMVAVAAAALVVLAVTMSVRSLQRGLDVWLAIGLLLAVVVSPVVWDQYLVALTLPLAWALDRTLSRKFLWVVPVLATQVLMLVARSLYPIGSIRGAVIAVATLSIAVVVVAGCRSLPTAFATPAS